MKIVGLIGSISSGGPAYSNLRLAQELCKLGCEVHVISLSEGQDTSVGAEWAPVDVAVVEKVGPRSFGYSPGWYNLLEILCPDLVHVNGLWMYHSLASLRWAKRVRPRVVTPHGMLMPWAFRYRRWKKLPIWLLWEKRGLQASVLHVTSEQEAVNIRALGLRAPVAVIPHGIDCPHPLMLSRPTNAVRRAIFLGRLHPVKGLVNLIEAWRQVRPRGWRLAIAGPDECGHLADLRRAVRNATLEGCIEFHGPLYGVQKQDFLTSSDLFILPSFSENFSVVVGEALASGIPVITTRGTPWKCLEDYNCGWWVDVGVEPLARAISEATQCTSQELRAMGERGRRLVEERFSWPKVAGQMKALYKWVLGGGPRPEWVETV